MSEASAAAPGDSATFRKIAWRIVPLLFLGYIVAFLDRVNVGFAKLQMASDLGFSDAIYGFGAGIFFIGYFVFEVPSNLILRKVGARIWMARIMITWGIISSLFMFTGMVQWGPVSAAFGCTDEQFTFYVLRFLLGAAEAGFFPGVILYLTFWFPAQRRAQMVAWFMTGIAISNIVGSPVSGAILQYMDGANGMRGWQWLFLLEGIPSVAMGVVFFLLLVDSPAKAKWLSDAERDLVLRRLAEEAAAKGGAGERHGIAQVFADWRIWAFGVVYFTGALCLYTTNFWMPTLISEFGDSVVQLPADRPSQHDSVGHHRHRASSVGLEFRPHGRAALAYGRRLRHVRRRHDHAGCDRRLTRAADGRADAGDVRRALLGRRLLVDPDIFPVGRRRSGRDRLDQRRRQSRRAFRPRPDRAHPGCQWRQRRCSLPDSRRRCSIRRRADPRRDDEEARNRGGLERDRFRWKRILSWRGSWRIPVL